MRNVEYTYKRLLKLVPVQFIRNVINRAHRADEGRERLLLAEELEVLHPALADVYSRKQFLALLEDFCQKCSVTRELSPMLLRVLPKLFH